MYELAQLVPDVEVLLALEPEELGAKLGALVRKRFGGEIFHPGNLTLELCPLLPSPLHPSPYPFAKRPEIEAALGEAWASLEAQGLVVPAPGINGRNGWRVLSRRAQSFKSEAEFAQGAHIHRTRTRIAGQFKEAALEELKGIGDRSGAPAPSGTEPRTAATRLALLADSRVAELRKLHSARFDFKKLIRLCEEINTVYSGECYFATAMLVRGILDHVPPLFGQSSFKEVANNYGGGKSFKEAMEHLENAARKVADAHLHMPIRKSETLPTAQQVNFASQLDVLLAEIVRITQ